MAIDDIVARIASDAESEAAALFDAARADAERIVEAARDRAETRAARALARARTEAERDASTLLAGARLSSRDALLTARNASGADALARVEAALLALPDKAYAAVLARAIAPVAAPGSVLMLGTDDAVRLRTTLPDALRAVGVEVSVSDVPADVARGVVIGGDRVRVEVSPAAIVAARREELAADIDRGLFGQEG